MTPQGSTGKQLPILLMAGCLAVGIALGFGIKSSFPSLLGGSVAVGTTQNLSGKSDNNTGSADSGSKDTNTVKNGVPGSTKDFAACLGSVMKLRGNKQWRGVMDLIDQLDLSQIPEALVALQTIHGSDRQVFLGELLSHWAEKDPKGALAYAQGVTKWTERIELVTSVLEGWVKNDPTGAVAWVQQLPEGAIKTNAFNQVVQQLAQIDPQKAVQLANSQKGTIREDLLSMVLSDWATQDLNGAMDYFHQMTNSVSENGMLQGMILSVATQDATRAVALVGQLPPGELQNLAFDQVASLWANSDPQAAQAWANRQTDPHIKATIQQGIVDGMAQGDPQGAVGYAVTLPAGDGRDNALKNAVTSWANIDPAAAITWAKQQTDPHIIDTIWPQVTSALDQGDPQIAAGLVQNFPQGQIRNTAIQKVGFQMSQTDPASAIQFVSTISDENQRNAMEQSLASNWMHNDPNAATQWINNSSLPAQIKKNILQQK